MPVEEEFFLPLLHHVDAPAELGFLLYTQPDCTGASGYRTTGRETCKFD